MRRSHVLTKTDKKALRADMMRRVTKQFGFEPVAWDPEQRVYRPTISDRFFDVQCPLCGRRYRYNQHHYQLEHLVNAHGFKWLDALHGATKGVPRG